MISKYEYSSDEWMEHFDYFFRSPQGSGKTELLRYFGAEYKHSGSEGCWKMNRCGTALAYLMRHLDDFEQFVVCHQHSETRERLALISAPIVFALWRYYGAIPDEHLQNEPDPEVILALAED